MGNTGQKRLSRREKIKKRKRRIRILSVFAVLLLIAAWMFGYFRSGLDVKPLLPNVLPMADRYQRSGNIFIGYKDGQIVGYAGSASSVGYGGPLEMLVGIDPQGKIVGLQVVDHTETPGFFRLLAANRFFKQYLNLEVTQSLYLDNGIDGVSGATLSAEAVASSVRQVADTVATSELNKTVPKRRASVKFGVPEIALIALFVTGYFAHKMRGSEVRNYKKAIRWVTMIVGIVVIGFMYNKPFTLANVTSFLAGYWPNWRTNLYWFLLIGGILFATTVHGKNPYCHWFCPFGSTQEVLSRITDVNTYRPRNLHGVFKWVQRGIAYFAILFGLALRQPAATSPEPFGTLFNQTGDWPSWVLLVVVLLTSLIIYRPFCNYLCPLHPVVDFISEIRRWIRESWREIWVK